MGRSHDYFCPVSRAWWSPFDFDSCPDHGDGCASFYDLNHEAGEEACPGCGAPNTIDHMDACTVLVPE